MMNTQFFSQMMEEKLMGLHTAYIAKVLSINGDKASVQPLAMTKQYGVAAQKSSPVTAYLLNNAKYRLQPKSKSVVAGITTEQSNGYITKVSPVKEELSYAEPTPLKAGDIVFCVCADRNITEAVKGNLSVPPIGHHSMSDSVIVGVL